MGGCGVYRFVGRNRYPSQIMITISALREVDRLHAVSNDRARARVYNFFYGTNFLAKYC